MLAPAIHLGCVNCYLSVLRCTPTIDLDWPCTLSEGEVLLKYMMS